MTLPNNLERAREFASEIRERVRTNNWSDFPATMDSAECLPAVSIPLSLIAALLANAIEQARLEEAQWWIKHLEDNGDEVLDSDRARVAELRAASEEKK